MIYSLPSKRPLELEANLKCLQDCAPTDKRFRADLKAVKKVRLSADGLMKPSKTNAPAPASPMNPNKSRFTILFLCTGNSARSIFAEYLLKEIAPIRFETYSAGASPKPAPHPLALEVLREDFKIDASDAYSKSWDEFRDVPFDFVITLCDNARETCPVWPGQPILAHWSSPDPAAVEGSDTEKRRAFWQVAQQIRRRLELLASLPFEKLDVLRLEAATKEIGVREKIEFGDQTPA